MKNYKQITYRYLKGQMNRTLLTILGIILSVATVSAIGTIIVSVRGALVTEAIRQSGSYHAVFNNVSKENIDKIINHVGVEKSGVSKLEGFGIVSEITDLERERYDGNIPPYRYIEIEEYQKEALELLPYKIKEGRFAQTSSEIVIDASAANYFEGGVKIGDKIHLTIGDRIFNKSENSEGDKREETFEKKIEKEYTVVGFIQSRFSGSGVYLSQGFTTLDANSPDIGEYNVYITVPNVKNANEQIFSIGKDAGVDEKYISTNYRLLRLSAESLDETFNKTIVALSAFVILLIMVSTIAVIYNAFNISVLERISQFGLLRSVGATPQQIHGIVIKEALILSAIGIPIGLLSGVLAMKIVFYIIGLLSFEFALLRDMEITINYGVFLFGTIIGLITVLLSAIGPAKKAGKVSPLEAVRNTGSFKKESFNKVRKSKFIRKILGVEGEIAYKNLRRNRKRFWITVFSMVISISLFITFSTFSDFMFKMGIIETQDMGDFIIRGNGIEEIEEMYKELKEIKDVKVVYKVRDTNGAGLIRKEKISKKMMEMLPNIIGEKEEGLARINNVRIYTIGDENFEVLKGFLKEGVVDKEELDRNNGVLVINNTYAYNERTNKSTLIEGYHIKPGDKIPFATYMSERKAEGKEVEYNELKVMGVLDKGILGQPYNNNAAFNLITTEKIFDSMMEEDNNIDSSAMYIEMKKEGDLELIRTYLKEKEESNLVFDYIDYAESAKEYRVIGIIMSIFLYGFVTIITLIGCINIINTISTNIILRTKEISMIKAVGMTQLGIKKMVVLESLYYGLYAAVFGGVTGTALTFILFKIVFNIREFEWSMPWKNIAIACIGATIVALLSGIYPLKRINENIIVENMKAEN